jgi:hypothetical protein
MLDFTTNFLEGESVNGPRSDAHFTTNFLEVPPLQEPAGCSKKLYQRSFFGCLQLDFKVRSLNLQLLLRPNHSPLKESQTSKDHQAAWLEALQNLTPKLGTCS